MNATYENRGLSVRVLFALLCLEWAAFGVVKGYEGLLLGWIVAALNLAGLYLAFNGSFITTSRIFGQRRVVALVVLSVSVVSMAGLLWEKLSD